MSWACMAASRLSQLKSCCPCSAAAAAAAPSCTGIVAAGNKLVDSGASLVPESVPRPVARAGVTVAMSLFAFGVLKQVRHETRLAAACPAIAHSTLCAPWPQPLPWLSAPPLHVLHLLFSWCLASSPWWCWVPSPTTSSRGEVMMMMMMGPVASAAASRTTIWAIRFLTPGASCECVALLCGSVLCTCMCAVLETAWLVPELLVLTRDSLGTGRHARPIWATRALPAPFPDVMLLGLLV